MSSCYVFPFNYLPFDIIILILSKVSMYDSINLIKSCRKLCMYGEKIWVNSNRIRRDAAIFEHNLLLSGHSGAVHREKKRREILSIQIPITLRQPLNGLCIEGCQFFASESKKGMCLSLIHI